MILAGATTKLVQEVVEQPGVVFAGEGQSGVFGVLAEVDGTPDWLLSWGRVLLDDGVPIAAFGVLPRWPGVAGAWALVTDAARRKPVAVARHVLLELRRVEPEFGRIEAAVDVSYSQGSRWLQAMGFEWEGTMKNFGWGGTGACHLFARTS